MEGPCTATKTTTTSISKQGSRNNVQGYEPDHAERGSHSPLHDYSPVAPVAYRVILEPGIGQFREFEPQNFRLFNRGGEKGRHL